ncbi:MAG: GC-type dockerin domain-anchored protein [Phycisphaerales bacterium]
MTARIAVSPLAIAALAGLAATLAASTANAQTIVRVSQRVTNGVLFEGDNTSFNPQIAANGGTIKFISSANNISVTAPVSESREVWTWSTGNTSCGLETITGFESPPLSNPRGINGSISDLSYRGGQFYYTCDGQNGTLCVDSSTFDDIYSDTSVFSTYDDGPCNTAANGHSAKSAVSGDGSRVAFETVSTNLLGPGNPTNGMRQIIVKNVSTEVNSIVSVTGNAITGITHANGNCFNPSLNQDGTICCFASDATNLVTGSNNGVRQIYVRRPGVSPLFLPFTERVSNDINGNAANSACDDPFISDDGRYVVFASDADDIVSGVSSGVRQIFLYDRTLDTMEHVSRSSVGATANGACSKPFISGNGRYVVFVSSATNLISGDSGALAKIYIHDRSGGSTRRVTNDTDGGAPNGSSDNPAISDNGFIIAFDSNATDLVDNDSAGERDVFVATYPGSPPTNDVCAKAVNVGPGLHSFDTVDADTTLTGSEACSPSRVIYHDAWYRYVATRTGNVTVTTQGLTTMDSILAIYSSCPTSPGSAITCNDDTSPGFQSRVVFAAVNGADYYIRLGNYGVNSAGGTPGTGQFRLINCPADVAGLGGSAGGDGSLTPDDLVYFLQQFFNNNLAVCDIAILGGNPGADGQITPDDLVYFLNLFFNNCA